MLGSNCTQEKSGQFKRVCIFNTGPCTESLLGLKPIMFELQSSIDLACDLQTQGALCLASTLERKFVGANGGAAFLGDEATLCVEEQQHGDAADTEGLGQLFLNKQQDMQALHVLQANDMRYQ